MIKTCKNVQLLQGIKPVLKPQTRKKLKVISNPKIIVTGFIPETTNPKKIVTIFEPENFYHI